MARLVGRARDRTGPYSRYDRGPRFDTAIPVLAGRPASRLHPVLVCHRRTVRAVVETEAPWLRERAGPWRRRRSVDRRRGRSFARHRQCRTEGLCRALIAEGQRSIIIDPDAANARAIRAYEKAGFQPFLVSPEPGNDTQATFIMTYAPDNAAPTDRISHDPMKRTLERAVLQGILRPAQRDALVALARDNAGSGPVSGETTASLFGRRSNAAGRWRQRYLLLPSGIVLLFFRRVLRAAGRCFLKEASPSRPCWRWQAGLSRKSSRGRSGCGCRAPCSPWCFSAAALSMLTELVRSRFELPDTLNAFSRARLAGGCLADRADPWRRGHDSRRRSSISPASGSRFLAAVTAIAATGLAFLGAILIYHDRMTSGAIAAPAPDQLAEVLSNALAVPLVSGLVIFAVAVMLDLRDRERQTVWSELRLLAARGLGTASGTSAVHSGDRPGGAVGSDRAGHDRRRAAGPDDGDVRAGGAGHLTGGRYSHLRSPISARSESTTSSTAPPTPPEYRHLR